MTTELLEPSEVARILGVTPQRVRQLAMTGVLFPVAMRGRTRLYAQENVEAVAAAKHARDAVKHSAPDRAPAVDAIADAVERRELRKIARENLSRAHQRARARLDGMQRRLEQLNHDQVVVAAELAAIEAEREHLIAAVERLAAELGTKGH